MADDGWKAEWRGLIGKLVTASREGIRNASKFAIAHLAEAETVVQVRSEKRKRAPPAIAPPAQPF